MKWMHMKAVVASLLVTGTALAAFPGAAQATAVVGTGTSTTIDSKIRGRYVTGGGNFVVTANTSPVMPVVTGDPVEVSTDPAMPVTTTSQATSASLDVDRTVSQALTIDFECHAVASYDATQTRVVPGGCVLYKGGTVVGSAPGQSLPGPTAATRGTATVSLLVPGELVLCWNVSATYLLNGGVELYNSDCTV